MKRKIIFTALCFAALKTNVFAGFECAASGPFAQCKTAADAFNKCLKIAHPKIFQNYKADFVQGNDVFLHLEFENMARKPLANPVVKYKNEVDSISDVNCLSKLNKLNPYVKFIDNDPVVLSELKVPVLGDIVRKDAAENAGVFSDQEIAARRAAIEKKVQLDQQIAAQKEAQKAAQLQAAQRQAAANQAAVAAQAQNQAQVLQNQQLAAQQICDTSPNGKCKSGKGAFDCLALKNPEIFNFVNQDPSHLEIKKDISGVELRYGGDQFSSHWNKAAARFAYDGGDGMCMALLDTDKIKFSEYVDLRKNPPLTPEQKAARDAKYAALGMTFKEDPNKEQRRQVVMAYYFGNANTVAAPAAKAAPVPGMPAQG